MNFQIQGLPRARFAPLFVSDPDSGGGVRDVAEKAPTTRFPCRVGLLDPESGESVLPLGYEHSRSTAPLGRVTISVGDNPRRRIWWQARYPK